MTNSTRINSGRTQSSWLRVGLGVGVSTFISMAILASVANAQQTPEPLPDLSGSYTCEGDETACGWSGNMFRVTQSGANLVIKNEKGDIGHAKLTSRISLSAGPIWNMLGVIVTPDNRTIQWSNGTNWRKT